MPSKPAHALLAVAVTAMLLLLPAAAGLPPAERPLPESSTGGDADVGDAGDWPVTDASRVPVEQRPWLLQAHDKGRAYDQALLDVMGPLGGDDEVEVLVQFEDGTDAGDTSLLSRLGLRLLHRYTGVDACHVRGPAAAVWRLVDSGRAWYVEPVVPIVHDMEVGTYVINASKVWSTFVQQRMGTPSRPIDGTGVTCVVVDTGIDASHPDLDYGTKVIMNLRSDTGDGPYYEVENSDLGYGHGTHVAGTVAGNGDGSAGARRGVAPGANLIGLTVDTDNSAGYIGALDWIWQNSRPGNNPHNIRLFTNSWHSTVEEYDPQKALIVLINAIAFENNVVSTWSAGNDGRDDPEGNELTTSGQGNTPVAMMCAAFERDGSGVADFSSRGRRGASHTYPDVGGPGVRIWSCAARRTIISAGSYAGGNTNPYYLAISGTSMSTPHLAGVVALLWQAAPSLTISDKREDHSGDPGDWFERDDTRIHEIEWIIEATATFRKGQGLGVNGIPSHDPGLDGYGLDGQPIDYVQGYGLINAERAVAVALALEQLRMDNPGEDITVADALVAYQASMEAGERGVPTDQLVTAWDGEWGRFTEDPDVFFKPYSANQTKLVWVPEGTETVDLELKYSPLNAVEMSTGTVTWTVDFGADGSVDARGDMTPSLFGVRAATIPASGHEGEHWAVGVEGQGLKIHRPFQDRNYIEVRIEYRMSLVAHLASGQGALVVSPPDVDSGYYHAYSAPWAFGVPSMDYAGGTVELPYLAYNVTRVELGRPVTGPGGGGGGGEGGGWAWWLVAVLVLVVLAVVVWRYRHRVRMPPRVGRMARQVRRSLGRVTRRSSG